MKEKPNPEEVTPKDKPEDKPVDKPEVTPEDKPSQEELINALREEVNSLKAERETDKATIEELHTKNQELASSVVGIKDELKKFKEEYAEQFNRSSNEDEKPKVTPRPFTPYSKEVAEFVDLISK